MATPLRVEKVSILLRELAASLIARELEFAEGTLVTVTRAAVSEDLRYATIFVSVLGGGATADQEAIAVLTRHTPEIQRALNRKLSMRPVPKIRFAIDKGEQHRERIEKLLSEDHHSHY